MQIKPWRVICRNRDGYEEGEPEDFTQETEVRRRMARLKEQNPELTVELLRARPADDAATTGIFFDGSLMVGIPASESKLTHRLKCG